MITHPHSLPIRVAIFLLMIFAVAVGATSHNAVAVSASSPQVGDWPMYGHDPQRTSYAPDEKAISADNIDQLEQAWQVNVGMGDRGKPAFSAPVVVGNTVYVASSVSNANNLFALDAESGTAKWSAFIGYNAEECFGVGIGSTPAFSDNELIMGGGDSAYYGINASDGSILWRNPLDAGPSGFAWVSPLIANGRTYVGVASDCDNPATRGEVRELNAVTGEHVTSGFIVPEGETGGDVWNSPALSEDGSTLYVATGEDNGGFDGPYTRALLAMDANTLEIRDADRQGVPNEDLDWATTPILFRDSSRRSMVGAGQKNGTFYAYDAHDLSAGPLWSWTPGPNVGMLAAYDPEYGDGGILVIGTRQGTFGLNPTDGSGIWVQPPFGELHGSFAIANGLIFANTDNYLVILDASTGEMVRTITPPNSGVTFSGPAISAGTVYWMSGAFLNAWKLPASALPSPEPAPDPTLTNPYYECGDSHECMGVI